MLIHIKPETREMLFFYLCFVASMVVLWPLALPIGLGAVFAYLSENILVWFQKKVHVTGKKGRAFLTAGFICLVVLLFLIPITVALYIAIKDLVSFLKEWNASGSLNQMSGQANSWLKEQLSKWEQILSASWMADIGQKVRGSLLSGTNTLFQKLSGVVTAAPRAFFALFLVILSWFTFAVAGPKARERFLQKLIPWEKERGIISETTSHVLRSLILSNILVAFVQTMICTIALASLQVPRFLLWGMLTFFASFVPAIGTALITIGATLYLFLQHRTIAGMIMLAVCGIIATVDNFLRPLFMKGKMELNFFWILVSFVGGVSVFGIIGVVLGPLLLSLCLAFLKVLEKREVF